MPIINLLLSGCATSQLTEYAGVVNQTLDIQAISNAYIDETNIYICFEGKGVTYSRSREPNVIINYPDNIFKSQLRKGTTSKGINYETAHSNKMILKTPCKKISSISSNPTQLPIYTIHKKLICEPMKSCSSLEWVVNFKSKTIAKGNINNRISYGDSSIINTILQEALKEQKITRAIFDSKQTIGRNGKGGNKSSFYYFYSGNYRTSEVKTNKLHYKNPVYPLYILTPFTVAWDIVTFPIQLILVYVGFNNAWN